MKRIVSGVLLGTALIALLLHFHYGNIKISSFAVKTPLADEPMTANKEVSAASTIRSAAAAVPGPSKLSGPAASRSAAGYTEVAKASRINNKIKKDFSNVIFLGDSITFGFMKANNTPVLKDHVYAKIGAHVFEGTQLLGDDSELIENRCNGAVDYVFIMFGANDYGYSLSDYQDWYSQLVEHIKLMFPGARIVLQAVLPMNSTAQEPERNQEPAKLNTIVRSVAAKEQVQYLELVKDIPGIRKLLLTDGLHYKPQLYPLWVKALEENFPSQT